MPFILRLFVISTVFLFTACLPAETASISTAERDSRINQYFRAANDVPGILACGMVLHERDVDGAKREAVRQRDGNRCIICGSSVKLEVDHTRAIQNGGDNEMSNLGTLCDDCHTIKTRLDSSVRRKRGKLCREK